MRLGVPVNAARPRSAMAIPGSIEPSAGQLWWLSVESSLLSFRHDDFPSN